MNSASLAQDGGAHALTCGMAIANVNCNDSGSGIASALDAIL